MLVVVWWLAVVWPFQHFNNVLLTSSQWMKWWQISAVCSETTIMVGKNSASSGIWTQTPSLLCQQLIHWTDRDSLYDQHRTFSHIWQFCVVKDWIMVYLSLQARDNMKLFLMAGSETTASSIPVLIYLLTTYPEVQVCTICICQPFYSLTVSILFIN